MPVKSERATGPEDDREIRKLIAQAVEGHLRRLVVALLDVHDNPASPTAASTALSEAQAVASALLAVDLDVLSGAARAIADTLAPLAASQEAVPLGAVVALLDATAGLRAVVAAYAEGDPDSRTLPSLTRELDALAAWREGPVSAPDVRDSAARRGEVEPVALVPAEAAPPRRADAPHDLLRVVPTIDLRTAADHLAASLSSPTALADLLGGLSTLADVLARTTSTLNRKLAELAELPELAELESAVQALGRTGAADSGERVTARRRQR
jgi:hypothetical protein